MGYLKHTLFPILLAALWIGFSEFVRNELLLKAHWVGHYRGLGLEFPSETPNNLAWGLWSLLFAIAIYGISRRFSLLRTTGLAWFMGFVLMWVVVGNLGVLPGSVLYLAVPLSLVEVFVASWIVSRHKA